MRAIILSLLLTVGDLAASYAQQHIIVLPPSLRDQFNPLRDKRTDDSTTLENARITLTLYINNYRDQLSDSDIMIVIDGARIRRDRAEADLRKDDANIKPVEDEIKRLIRNPKGFPVIWRSPAYGNPRRMETDTYIIQNDRVYIEPTYENLEDPKGRN